FGTVFSLLDRIFSDGIICPHPPLRSPHPNSIAPPPIQPHRSPIRYTSTTPPLHLHYTDRPSAPNHPIPPPIAHPLPTTPSTPPIPHPLHLPHRSPIRYTSATPPLHLPNTIYLAALPQLFIIS
ncbi:MAG: hypothetical protein MUF72_19180, partial [Elainella sp. Prado103]|nr:hypothetical protein [Elainella sp. Prado103]